MSVWNKFSMLMAIAPTRRVAAAEVASTRPQSEVDMARRWARARRNHPALVDDLIRLGGILAAQPMQAGEVLPIDTVRLAYEAGRRDLALQLAAMMSLTINELNDLMESKDA